METANRKCNICAEIKPLDEFFRDNARKDGIASRCKSCQRAATARWVKANPEKSRAIKAASQVRRRDHRIAYGRQYYYSNVGRAQARTKLYWNTVKDAAYAAYGGYVCACCGETEPLFLCLDHVDGAGNEHRRLIGGADRLYVWLKKNNYPTGLLQVLCFNCNQGKRLNNNVCPHRGALYGIDIQEVRVVRARRGRVRCRDPDVARAADGAR
jgi:hypothetical protein